MSAYDQFIAFKIEEKLRNQRVTFKLDGYDADTVIMALKHYEKELKSFLKKLMEGDSISVYSETVKRLYSAEFLADRLMEQVGKVIEQERKKKHNEKK